MIEYFVIGGAALATSLLTFFSGFGLGTILTPVFMLFFPIEIAIALTGVVHLLNNLFKFTLIGAHVQWKTAFKFGIPAIVGAFIGAWILTSFKDDTVLAQYEISGNSYQIVPVKVIIAALMIFFALFDKIPKLKESGFIAKNLALGGGISGFFGGLSGHQGALRSAFLIKANLTKEAFIATGVVLASVIDITRISVYFTRLKSSGLTENIPLIVVACLSAFIGAFAGKKLLHKVTFSVVHTIVTIMLVGLAILLGIGII